MNVKAIAVCALLATAILPMPSQERGFAGGGFRGGGMSRPSGGFDFHNDVRAPSKPPGGNYSHSSTGAYGTSRTTNVSNTGGGYNRTTTANNGNYHRTANASSLERNV